MTTSEQPKMAEHTVELTRRFEAPRELVWEFWTDPDRLARWWGPENFTTPRESVEIDLRPGGAFRTTMVGPDGSEYPGNGVFREVAAPERLVFAEDETDHPMIERSLAVVTLTELDDGATELRLEQTMVCVEELPRMAKMGWSSQLDKLERLLAESA